MKKILIGLLVIVGAVVILPLIGNKVVENKLNTQIEVLSSNGVKVVNTSSQSSYFDSAKHYEFMLEDGDKFVAYINQFSDNQIPSYVNMMLEGMIIGMDIEYSNILFNSDVKIDIYPLTLSNETASNVKKNDTEFYQYITKFLKIKGLLYHINYDMSSNDFSGYLKDINEEYTFKDSTVTKLVLTNMTYDGSGSLLHPDEVNSKIDKIVLFSTKQNEELEFSVNNIKASSVFKSQTTYKSSANVQDIIFKLKGLEEAIIEVKDIDIDLAANTEGAKASFSMKSSIDKFDIKSNTSNIVLDKLNYEVDLKDIDKDSFEEMRVLISKSNTMNEPALQDKIQKSMIKLLSKGLVLDIKDISIDKISLDDKKDVDAFDFNAHLEIKEDPDFLKNVNTNPKAFLQNITLDSKLRASKDFFTVINQKLPLTTMAGGFAKEVGNDYVFELKFENSKLSVNGKVLQ